MYIDLIKNNIKLDTFFKTVIAWIPAHSIVFVIFHQLIGYEKILISSPYFIIINIIIFLIFKDIFKISLSNIKIKDYLFLMVAFILHALTYWFCNTYLGKPIEFLQENTASFFLVNEYFLWVKPIDIVFQQLMIYLLIWKLDKLGMSLLKIILAIGTIFGIAHIYSIQHMELIPTILLTILTTIISIAFPYLILRTKNGVLYNFVIHLIGVDIVALMIWWIF